MRHDPDGQLVEVGARTRTIPPALRRALHHRDRICRFPGCRARFGQGHHIRHWAEGGPTTLSNLAVLCRRHHRAVHEEGYKVERRPDGAVDFRRPNGWVIPDVPPAPDVPAGAAEIIRARNSDAGLEIDAHTATPRWLGERLDLRYAIDVLHPRAADPHPGGAPEPPRPAAQVPPSGPAEPERPNGDGRDTAASEGDPPQRPDS
jgi:hypothetical protein